LRRLLDRLWFRHRRGSVAALILSLLAAATEGLGLIVLLPLLAALGIGALPPALRDLPVLGTRDGGDLGTVLAVFLLVLALRQLIVFLHHVVVMRTRLDFAQALREDLVAALAGAGWRHLPAGNLHRQTQILTLDSHRAGDAAQHLFGLAAALIVAAVQLGIAGWVSLPFTLPVAVGALLAGYLMRSRVQRIARLGRELTASHEAVYGMLSNLLPMLRTVRLTGRTSELTERFREKSESVNRSIMQYAVNHTANAALIQLGSGIVLCTCIVFWVKLHGIDAMQLTVLVLVFARLTPVVTQVHQFLQKLAHELPALQNAVWNIDLWRGRADDADAGTALTRPRHTIGLAGVSGGYDGDRDHVLHGVTVVLPAGKVSALTGPTGAGKSTLADILAGMLPPAAGAIELDGSPLGARDLAAWRRRVGYVDQDAVVLSGTVRDNLEFAAGEIDAAWCERVLEAAKVSEFLHELPGGLDAPVGEQGALLSGGQRKRIAVARELLRRPWLLILDEATSSLDYATSAALLEGIAALPGAPAVLLISHDESAVSLADTSFHLEAGRVVQEKGR
jgi:ATP-binding cassette subfamily C protein